MASAIKTYRLNRRAAFPSRTALQVLEVSAHVQQVEALVVATSVTAAAAILTACGFWRPSRAEIGPATGNDIDMLTAAGLLERTGTVLMYRGSTKDSLVASITETSTEVVGVWRFVERIDGGRASQAIVFERVDGDRFAHRS